MRLLFNMCCVLLIISCSTSVSTESIIIKDLHAQVSNEGSTLRIDTLVVVSNKAISTFDVVQEELMFLRRFNSDLKETVNLNLQLKELLLEDLNEINHLNLTIENKSRLDYLYKQINSCDSTINLCEPQLTKNTNEISSILTNTEFAETDQLQYKEISYFIKGQVDQKILNDTVVIYIRNGMESIYSLTNVLYVGE
ncbi:MAG: hypothetical protein HN488_10275 [Saprospiraceae bacterium]|nr:hypothetical protein [Saprospiraceae bacterium]